MSLEERLAKAEDWALLWQRHLTIKMCLDSMKRTGIVFNGDHTPTQTLYYTTINDLLTSGIVEMSRYAHEALKPYNVIWKEALTVYFQDNPEVRVIVTKEK